MDNRRIIGDRINTALAIADKKQKELAANLGVKDNVISYFVSGARTPNTEQIIKISEFLGVSADYLLGLSDVASVEPDIKMICDYTGLTEDSVVFLMDSTEYYKKVNMCYEKEKTLPDSDFVKWIDAQSFENEKIFIDEKFTEWFKSDGLDIENKEAKIMVDTTFLFDFINNLLQYDGLYILAERTSRAIYYLKKVNEFIDNGDARKRKLFLSFEQPDADLALFRSQKEFIQFIDKMSLKDTNE